MTCGVYGFAGESLVICTNDRRLVTIDRSKRPIEVLCGVEKGYIDKSEIWQKKNRGYRLLYIFQ